MLCARFRLQYGRNYLEEAIRCSTEALITASVVTIRFDESVKCPALSLLQALRLVESLLKETICQKAPDDLEVASGHLHEALELLPELHLRHSSACMWMSIAYYALYCKQLV